MRAGVDIAEVVVGKGPEHDEGKRPGLAGLVDARQAEAPGASAFDGVGCANRKHLNAILCHVVALRPCSRLRRRGRFLLQGVDPGPAQPKYAAAAGERLIDVASFFAQEIEPVLRRQCGRPLADLDHRTVRREAGVNDHPVFFCLHVLPRSRQRPEPKPRSSIVMFSDPSTLACQASRDFELSPTMLSSFSFSSRAILESPLRPSCTKMWQEPHLAWPSHLCRMPISAPSKAAKIVVPSPTSIVLPAGRTVSVDIQPSFGVSFGCPQ